MKPILVIINNPRQASYRLRIQALVQKLAQRGLQLDIQVRPRSWMARRRLLRSADQYHCVLLQRKFLDPSNARLLRRKSRRIVFDVDDAVMYPQKPLNAFKRWLLTRRFHTTAGIVDHVVAGNEYLADHFRQRGCAVTILPTVVDPSHYCVKQHAPTTTPRLVWIGSRSTLPYLRQFLPAIESAARQVKGLRLQIIADENLDGTILPVDFVKWSEDEESQALRQGDIGIAPTPSNPWTLGKCGFKIVQYMAAGLPVIASPVGANAELVREGITGFLPKTKEEWTAAILQLANDPELRAHMGQAARKIVEMDYHLDRAADVWAALLD
jgi:glycosyltransferase involved in cell wall biosynthesis